METVKLFEKTEKVTWDYDEEADVFYLSFGEPRKAVGIDVGEGLIIRFDENKNEIAGLTAYGLGQNLIKALKEKEYQRHPREIVGS